MTNGTGWRVARARNGRPALVRPDGVFAESRFRPDEDARRRVKEADIRPGDRVLLIGLGAGEMIRAILAATGPEGRVVAAEPWSGAFEAILSDSVSREIISDPRLSVVLFHPGGAEGAGSEDCPCRVLVAHDAASFLQQMADADKTAKYLIHPGVTFPEELAGMKRYLEDLEIRRRSAFRFAAHLEENRRFNESRLKRARTVKELEKTLPGSEIVVAGGGPSLLECARRMGSAANWIAVGTALRPLLSLGIDPLFAVVTDPLPAAGRQITRLLEENAFAARIPPLVAFPTTAPAAVSASPVIHLAYPEGDGGEELREERERWGELPAGGTVTTTALGLAVLLGARRILLAGVDLVEPGGATHAKGTAVEEERIRGIERFTSAESGRFIRSRPGGDSEAILVTANSGEEVPTRKNLMIYARAIEGLVARHRHVEFIQLSPCAYPLRGVATTAF